MSQTIREMRELRSIDPSNDTLRFNRTLREAGISLDDLTEDRGAGLISTLVLLVCAAIAAAVLWGACVLLFSVEDTRAAEVVRMHEAAGDELRRWH